MNNVIDFYSRSLYKQSLSNGFFQILFVYNADDTSVMTGVPSEYYNYSNSAYEDCFGNDFQEPYDPRCRSWYKFAKQNKDPISKDILMTTSTQIEYKEQILSVLSIDFGIKNIVKNFNNSQTNNSYFVLLSEKNNTIFYHPDLKPKSDLQSWENVEFWGIQEECLLKSSDEKIQCEMERNIFKEQVDASIQFMKTGNYSIENFYNTDNLFQSWTKNGTKKISLIYPVIQNVKQQNLKITDQKQYSYSILLTARVNDDTVDMLKLFNIFNSNIIKIPLIIEICILAISVLIFIFNYGLFQMHQVSLPIELLIYFLKKSLYQQQSYNAHNTSQKDLKNKNKAQQFQNSQPRPRKMSNPKKNAGNIKSGFFKRLDDFNSNTMLQYTTEQVPSPTRLTNVNLRINTNNYEEKKSDDYQKNSLFSKKLISPVNQSEDIKNTIESDLDNQTLRNNYCSQQRLQSQVKLRQVLSPSQQPILIKNNAFPLYNEQEKINQIQSENVLINSQVPIQEIKSAQEYPILLTTEHNTPRYKKESDYNCSIKELTVQSFQNFQNGQITNNEENEFLEIEEIIDNKQETILKGLNPLFLEMQIIKETFQTLEEVINYQIDSNSQNSQDNMNSLLHFAKAKGIFQKMKNQQGHCRCFFNLGVVYLLKHEYILASEYFEAAIQLNLQNYGIDSIFQINDRLLFNQVSDKEDQLSIFCKRLFSFAYSLKENAFQQIYKNTLLTEEDENLVQKNIPLEFLQKEYKIQNSDNQIIPQLQKCFQILKTVQNIIEKNHSQFTRVYQTFVYQEILEVLLYLKEQNKLIPEILCTLENFMKEYTKLKQAAMPSHIFKNQFEKDVQDNQGQFSARNNQEDQTMASNQALQQKKNSTTGLQGQKQTQIANILISKFTFLKGIIEKQQGNNIEALDYLTQSLEEGTHYSPYQRKKTLLNIKEILFEIDISQKMINEILQNISQNFDFILLIQQSTYHQQNSIENYLENLRQQNIFKKNDRISIVTFSSQINILMPFTQIENEKHWKLVQNILRQQNNDNIQLYSSLSLNERLSQSYINWKQALCYSLNYLYSHCVSHKLLQKKTSNASMIQTKIEKEFLNDIDYIYGIKEIQKDVEFILEDESKQLEDYTSNQEAYDEYIVKTEIFNDTQFPKEGKQIDESEYNELIESQNEQNKNVQERQKIILLFTKEQQYQQQQQNYQNIKISFLDDPQLNKTQIYHLKEEIPQDALEFEFISQYFTYNSFTLESLLIQKLAQIRNINQYNQQSEYLTVLNTF